MSISSPVSRRAFFAGIAAVGFSFTALGRLVGERPACAEEAPGSLTVLFNDAPTSLDPAVGWDGWYTVCRGITETLVQFDENMDLVAGLATEWSMDDESAWRFTVRKDVSFQTGKAMTPDEVKSSIERTVKVSARAANKLMLDAIEVDGDDIVITTTSPIATLPGELAEPVFSIVDVDAVEDTPETSGTGPFMGDEIRAMENFTLKRFDGYWGGAPSVEKLVNQTVTEPSARTIALQSGDADIAWSIQASDLALFENNDAYNMVTSESVRMVFGFMNFANANLAVKEVRQALSFATDRAGICDMLLSGAVETNGSLFPSYLSYSMADTEYAQTYDMDKAAALMEQAGFEKGSDGRYAKDGAPLALRIAYYESRPELPVIAQALQDQYGRLGIDVSLSSYENIDDLFHTDQFDIMLYNTTTIGNGDPSYYLGLYYASTGSENAGDYANDDVDQIIDQIRQEFDQQKRFDLAIEAQKLILEDCPNIFFGAPVMNLVARAGVDGMVLYPVEYYGVTNKIS